MSTLGIYWGGLSIFGTEALSKHSLGRDTNVGLILSTMSDSWQQQSWWVGFLPDWYWYSTFSDKQLHFRVH